MTDILDGMSEDERARFVQACKDVGAANGMKSFDEMVLAVNTALNEICNTWQNVFVPFLSMLFHRKRKKRRRPIMCNRRTHVGETYPGRSIKTRAR